MMGSFDGWLYRLTNLQDIIWSCDVTWDKPHPPNKDSSVLFVWCIQAWAAYNNSVYTFKYVGMTPALVVKATNLLLEVLDLTEVG